jgi:hypothetical protein
LIIVETGNSFERDVGAGAVPIVQQFGLMRQRPYLAKSGGDRNRVGYRADARLLGPRVKPGDDRK